MNIRSKITFLFCCLVILILTITSLSIYFFSENYRQDDFYRRLKNRATNTAKVLNQIKEVNAALLKRMEKNNPASLPNQYILIFNQSLEEVYSSDGNEAVVVDSELLNSVIKNKEIKFKQGDYEALGFLLDERSDRFIIIASATDVYGRDAIHNLRNILMLTFAGSLVMISILGWIYAGRVLKPISNIVAEVSTISELNLNMRLGEGNKKDELSLLAQTFNRMIGRLQSAFASQRSFIANASHEIKTPITVMSGQIEVTLLQERATDYYVATLKSVLLTLKGLNSLSTRLLTLAHSSADLADSHFTVIRIDDAIWEAKEELLKANQNYTVDVLFDSQTDDRILQIKGDEQLIRVAFLNLIDNGCKYSPDHKVTVSFYSHDSYTVIEFLNQGKEISVDDRSRIFEPFFRREVDKHQLGFGIGLSLIGSIVRLHKGEIAVTSEKSLIRFTVRLPIATA